MRVRYLRYAASIVCAERFEVALEASRGFSPPSITANSMVRWSLSPRVPLHAEVRERGDY